MTLYPYNQKDVSRLIPYARNARTHSDAQVAQIAASIREFGFINPVIVDGESGIIAGHGRVLAARKLGMKQVPTLEVSGLTEAQKRAYILADNKLALNAGWDSDLLKVELADLAGDGFNLDVIGFSADELNALMADTTGGKTAPEDVPPLADDAVTNVGDVWLLDRHRLVCGDSTKAAPLAVCEKGSVDCVFTSPPYAVGIDYGEYVDTIDNLRAMLPELSACWSSLVMPGGYAVVNFGDIVPGAKIAGASEPCEYPMAVEYWPVFRNDGWLLWTRRVWQKPHARVHSPWAIKSSRAASDWEHIWVWKRPGKELVGRGSHSAFGVWDTSKDHGVDVGKDVHGAGMAVGLATRAIETYSRPGRIVFEPFCGTGTTIIAAELTGRSCRAVELNPLYVDLSIRRWQSFTGKVATLEATGQPFTEVEHAAEAA